MNVYDVFTPTAVPTVTYIDRQDQNLEQQLRSAIKQPGLIASLSGPSKSGKTVLVNKVIPPDDLIAVSGAAIRNAEMLWDRVLNWMEAPSATSTTSGHTTGVEATGKASGKANLLFASGKVEGSLGASYENERSKETTVTRAGIDQVVREIANSNFVLFIDDFHYMPKETQSDVARQMKEAAEKGVCICTASVPHRADDVVRGNPELRGRVKAIDFAYWKPVETVEIGVRGFDVLGAKIDRQVIERLSAEAFGSPQLMQQICLQTCFYLQIEEPLRHPQGFNVTESDLKKIFEHAATTTEFSSLLDALHAGPKHRGTPRSEYAFADISRGDVYRCILLALLKDPPQLSFTYDDIYQRTRQVCVGTAPSGSSVAQALSQIHDMAAAIQPETPVIEWSDDVLDIADPYFLYYLRCSPRLDSLQRRMQS
jgi:hypothetical protein